MRFECPLVSGRERRDVPGTQRIAPLPDFHSLINCNADHRSLDAVLFGNRLHLPGMGGGNQYARRSFVEGQDFGAEVASKIDLQADFDGGAVACGEGARETAATSTWGQCDAERS